MTELVRINERHVTGKGQSALCYTLLSLAI